MHINALKEKSNVLYFTANKLLVKLCHIFISILTSYVLVVEIEVGTFFLYLDY